MEKVTRRELVAAAAGVAGLSAIGTVSAAGQQDRGQEQVGRPVLREGSEFVLVLNGIKLPDDTKNRIAGQLQGTLMQELAKVDLGGPVVFRIPDKDWYGIWLDRVRDLRVPTLRIHEVAGPGGF